jgi:hypothetical protein
MATKSKKKIGDRIREFADNEGPHGGRPGQAHIVMPRCKKSAGKYLPQKMCAHTVAIISNRNLFEPNTKISGSQPFK